MSGTREQKTNHVWVEVNPKMGKLKSLDVDRREQVYNHVTQIH